jgi:glycopeptide antibiotics resistance protein
MIQIKTSFLRKALGAYTLLIMVFAILPLNATSLVLNNIYIVSIRLDYLVHFAIFIPWMFLVRMAYHVSFREDLKRALLWVLVGLLLACISEGVQYFLTYRSYNINDLLGNIIGVILGAGFFTFAGRKVEI